MSHSVHNRTVFRFLWSVIKPYKGWYALMLQAPVLGGAYFILYHYSLKCIIDAIVSNPIFSLSNFTKGISLFIAAEVYLNVIWRISNVAEWKCEPYVRRNLLCTIFERVSHHAYSFFQNTQ